MALLLSARLDECGTDGRSPYIALAGAVARIDQWSKLELAWGRFLKARNVRAFHTKEFRGRDGDFRGWSDFKRKRFAVDVEKIIKRNTLFRIAVGVESAAHAEIKRMMHGMRGFYPDSDYGLCLRYLMFVLCKHVSEFDSNARIRFMLEDGPWAAGAVGVYSRVSRMTGKPKPARFAHMLDGIAVVPKGECLSLEVADYLVGTAHEQMMVGRFKDSGNPQISSLLKRPSLERWYKGMLDEKERRRNYARSKASPEGSTL